MSRNIKIIAVANEQPDVRLYVLALIALARQLQEAELAGGDHDGPRPQLEEGSDG